jgi:hypothetical protein
LAALGWSKEPGVAAWIAASRLDLLQALPEHLHEPLAQEAVSRFLTNVGPAIDRLGTASSGHDTMAP